MEYETGWIPALVLMWRRTKKKPLTLVHKPITGRLEDGKNVMQWNTSISFEYVIPDAHLLDRHVCGCKANRTSIAQYNRTFLCYHRYISITDEVIHTDQDEK
jgi:hypothetical protein